MKKNIAIIAGGYSGEYDISMHSAKNILKHINKEKYNPFLVHITKEKWSHTDENQNEFEIDKNDFSIALPGNKITFDCVFNVIHGTPGEDGKIQGYLDMLGIPYTSSNQYVSAMTFNKGFCNKIVKSLDVSVPNSAHLFKRETFDLEKIINKITIPAFVKPCNGGSSVGTSKINNLEELKDAVNLAFQYDDEILIEEFINGTELTCGLFRYKNQLIVFPITEIVPKDAFFDYQAKYEAGRSQEITPARISSEIEEFCASTSSYLYNRLNCSGVVRIDYILTRSRKLYFLEINTIPGMSEMSIIPQQAQKFGYTLDTFIDMLIEDAISK